MNFSVLDETRSNPKTWGSDANEKLPILSGGTWKRKRADLVCKKEEVVSTEIAVTRETKKAEKNIDKKSPVDPVSEMGVICAEILEDPERNLHKIKIVLNRMNDQDKRIKSLACISLVSLFSDIIPSYRIRPLTQVEAQEKVSKEVKSLRNFEQDLLAKYHLFLQSLGETMDLLSTQALCSLLLNLTHFNFRKNILMLVCKGCFSPNSEISTKCQESISKLFLDDESGEPSFEAVQIINGLLKTHIRRKSSMKNCIETLKTLLNLRLREEFRSVEQETKSTLAKQKNRHYSKKARKTHKENIEILRELREAEAVVSAEEKHKWFKETLKLIFAIYFRILKMCPYSDLLVPSLDGFSRFSHLIHIDVFHDLCKNLKQVSIIDDKLSVICKLKMVYTICHLTVIHGQTLMDMDLKHFHCLFYKTLLQISKSLLPEMEQVTDLIVSICRVLFWKRGESSANRLASYCHALASLASKLRNNNDLCSKKIVKLIISILDSNEKLCSHIISPDKDDNDEYLSSNRSSLGMNVPDPDLADSLSRYLVMPWMESESDHEWKSLSDIFLKLASKF